MFTRSSGTVGSSERASRMPFRMRSPRASKTIRFMKWFEVVQTRRPHRGMGSVRHYQVTPCGLDLPWRVIPGEEQQDEQACVQEADVSDAYGLDGRRIEWASAIARSATDQSPPGQLALATDRDSPGLWVAAIVALRSRRSSSRPISAPRPSSTQLEPTPVEGHVSRRILRSNQKPHRTASRRKPPAILAGSARCVKGHKPRTYTSTSCAILGTSLSGTLRRPCRGACCFISGHSLRKRVHPASAAGWRARRIGRLEIVQHHCRGPCRRAAACCGGGSSG